MLQVKIDNLTLTQKLMLDSVRFKKLKVFYSELRASKKYFFGVPNKHYVNV